MNPNMIFILQQPMREEDPDSPFYKATYSEGFPWIRNDVGNRHPEGGDIILPLIDFTHPDAQDIIVEQAIAAAKCGLYDGIFIDWWHEWNVILDGRPTNAEEQAARDEILRRIREEVREDFLILVNGNRRTMPRTGWAINGTFMETGRDYDRGYTHGDLAEIESTLLWTEENFREPRVNCLEDWGVPTESPDSPRNLRWMRVFTTMSLTHSDGYVLYIIGIRHPIHEHDWNVFEITHKEAHDRDIEHNHHHDHYWYDFYDAALGTPIGEKAQRYENRDGLFIREFTNGWAVYNRSGTKQTIVLPSQATGVASGTRKRRHILPDLDSEIYLKTVMQITPGKRPPLFWVDPQTGTLHRLVGDKVENLVPGIQDATHLTVDAAAEKLYWREKTGNQTGKIQCANLDGANVQLIRDLTSVPLDIAINTASNKLYVTNAWGKIQRMNLDGSSFQPNFITGLEAPGQVAVDAVGGKVYWTEKGSLRYADLKDGNIHDVVTGLGELADIALSLLPDSMAVAAAPVTQTVVEQTLLLANYPNPFNPETWIPYQLAEPSKVTLHIYATNGTLVQTLDLGHQSAGIYQHRSRAAYWDGKNEVGEPVASGIYFYTLTAGDFTATRKMLIRK